MSLEEPAPIELLSLIICCIPERPENSALASTTSFTLSAALSLSSTTVRIPQISCFSVGTDENRNGLQGIQEGKQLLLLFRTQLVELSGYVLRLTPMAIDRFLER